jgi:hypothetical protein
MSKLSKYKSINIIYALLCLFIVYLIFIFYRQSSNFESLAPKITKDYKRLPGWIGNRCITPGNLCVGTLKCNKKKNICEKP